MYPAEFLDTSVKLFFPCSNAVIYCSCCRPSRIDKIHSVFGKKNLVLNKRGKLKLNRHWPQVFVNHFRWRKHEEETTTGITCAFWALLNDRHSHCCRRRKRAPMIPFRSMTHREFLRPAAIDWVSFFSFIAPDLPSLCPPVPSESKGR